MKVQEAIEILSTLVYKPEWNFIATGHGRFDGAVKIDVTYDARDSSVQQAPNYENWIDGGARASFVILVGDIPSRDELCRTLILQVIVPIEIHEAREFLRYDDSLAAPCHPHTQDGMRFWGTPREDVIFGQI